MGIMIALEVIGIIGMVQGGWAGQKRIKSSR